MFPFSLRQEVSAGWQVGVRAVQCVRGVCMGAQAVGCPRSLSSLSLWTEVQGDKNSGTAMAHTCSGCGGAVLSVASHLRDVGSTLRGGRGPLGPGLPTGFQRASNGLPTGSQRAPNGLPTGSQRALNGPPTGSQRALNGLPTGFQRASNGRTLGAAWEWRRRCTFWGLKGRRAVAGPTPVS